MPCAAVVTVAHDPLAKELLDGGFEFNAVDDAGVGKGAGSVAVACRYLACGATEPGKALRAASFSARLKSCPDTVRGKRCATRESRVSKSRPGPARGVAGLSPRFERSWGCWIVTALRTQLSDHAT
jgi:hypothetical protein